MQDHDDYVTNGGWNTCDLCGCKFSDSDGDCSCEKWQCEKCGAVMDPEDDSFESLSGFTICTDCKKSDVEPPVTDEDDE